jgi:hypothetical protein
MGLSEAAFALPGPLILILSRVVSWSQVGDALRELGPTVLFLAGILYSATSARRQAYSTI